MGRTKKSEKYWKHSTQYYRKYKQYISNAKSSANGINFQLQCGQSNSKTQTESDSPNLPHYLVIR